ncbi:MAG: 50S ribosomal protein L37e [Nitrososphaerota archaeon]|nr:50S ribosomal protein L37e [Nitrososphaerota archaeon]MDG6922376.1 50S ribosomal protein L37e [Nitrososphaerota archaeon]
MLRGTSSMGKMGRKKTHIRCRRCGHHSYHLRYKRCSHCGFGSSTKLRSYSWMTRYRG